MNLAEAIRKRDNAAIVLQNYMDQESRRSGNTKDLQLLIAIWSTNLLIAELLLLEVIRRP